MLLLFGGLGALCVAGSWRVLRRVGATRSGAVGGWTATALLVASLAWVTVLMNRGAGDWRDAGPLPLALALSTLGAALGGGVLVRRAALGLDADVHPVPVPSVCLRPGGCAVFIEEIPSRPWGIGVSARSRRGRLAAFASREPTLQCHDERPRVAAGLINDRIPGAGAGASPCRGRLRPDPGRLGLSARVRQVGRGGLYPP